MFWYLENILFISYHLSNIFLMIDKLFVYYIFKLFILKKLYNGTITFYRS